MPLVLPRTGTYLGQPSWKIKHKEPRILRRQLFKVRNNINIAPFNILTLSTPPGSHLQMVNSHCSAYCHQDACRRSIQDMYKFLLEANQNLAHNIAFCVCRSVPLPESGVQETSVYEWGPLTSGSCISCPRGSRTQDLVFLRVCNHNKYCSLPVIGTIGCCRRISLHYVSTERSQLVRSL